MKRTVLTMLRAFTPRMAGASFRERTIACFGALLGIGLAGLISGMVAGVTPGLPLIVAPMGASAVLLFAVPASPLAQPWSIAGGNTISALTGLLIAHLIPSTAIAAAVAVAAAIAVMSALRCLHPPGGAVALSSVLGSSAAAPLGFTFALVPVGLNSLILVMLGLAFHRFSGHSYPHRPKLVLAETHGTSDPPPQLRAALNDADIDAAIADSGESFDISREDLQRLVRRAELAALERTHRIPRCAEIMSRDVLRIRSGAPWNEAHALLLAHDLRVLPVVDSNERIAGVFEMHELDHSVRNVAEAMNDAAVARPGDSIVELIDPLTDGRHHAVVIVDDERRIIGLITQTDMIVVLARLAVTAMGQAADMRSGAGLALKTV